MSGQGQTQEMPKGPPYAPQVWALGGKPSIIPDEPITAVFLFLFILSAIAHMTILQLNQKKGHKFLMSGLLFGFSMARVATTVIRLVSVRFPTDVPLAIGAQIFVSAGVVLLYIINLIFTQRMIRAAHPHFGWHRPLGWVFKALYALIVLIIIMVIVATVQSFYTLNSNTRRIDRDIQLTGATFFAFVSFLPIPMVILSVLIPRHAKLDKFGNGRWRTKVIILLTASTLICFGASWRAGTSYLTLVPRTRPVPWYFNKAAFYMINFGIEWIVLAMYAIVRVDRRFHVPNGARGPGSYSTGANNRKSVAETISTTGGDRSVRPSIEHEASLNLKSTSKLSLPLLYFEEETYDRVNDGFVNVKEKPTPKMLEEGVFGADSVAKPEPSWIA